MNGLNHAKPPLSLKTTERIQCLRGGHERPCERMRLTPFHFAGQMKQTKWKSGMPMCVGLDRAARLSALSRLFHPAEHGGIGSADW